MPLVYLLCFLISGVTALVMGYVGGVGALRGVHRILHELSDDIDTVQHRLSRREGKDGRDKRNERMTVDDELRQLMLAGKIGPVQASPPPAGPAVISRDDLQSVVRQVFRDSEE